MGTELDPGGEVTFWEAVWILRGYAAVQWEVMGGGDRLEQASASTSAVVNTETVGPGGFVQILILPFTSCMTFVKLLNLSLPQLPHL